MNIEAFARVRSEVLLAEQGWNNEDMYAVRYEVVLGGLIGAKLKEIRRALKS